VWTSDITYIATDEGWLYLTVILDLFSREVVGWSMRPHMRQELVVDALRMAWFCRRPAPELIMHSDRGSQYCGKDSTLGYLSPMQFERAWLAAQQR
jgi:putative transposase